MPNDGGWYSSHGVRTRRGESAAVLCSDATLRDEKLAQGLADSVFICRALVCVVNSSHHFFSFVLWLTIPAEDCFAELVHGEMKHRARTLKFGFAL